jgi:hypothetical protein
MPKPKAASNSPRKTPKDYAANCHRFYAQANVVAALDGLAHLNKMTGKKRDSRSALILGAVSGLLRQKAAELRAAGVEVPESVFIK